MPGGLTVGDGVAKLMVMEHETRTLRRSGAQVLPCLLLTCWLVAGGCGDDTDPAAPTVTAPDAGAVYTPATVDVDLARDTYLDFRVAAVPGRSLRVRWQRADEPEAGGERFRFFARQLGRETLRAHIEDGDGRSWQRTWTITIEPTGGPRAEFVPAELTVDAFAGVESVFRVRTPWTVDAVAWRLDGAAAGTDTLLRLVPPSPGRHELAVAVQIGDSAFARTWEVTVRPFAEAAPPPVAGLAVVPGNAPGRAVLSWEPSLESVLPLEAYEIRYRWDGPPRRRVLGRRQRSRRLSLERRPGAAHRAVHAGECRAGAGPPGVVRRARPQRARPAVAARDRRPACACPDSGGSRARCGPPTARRWRASWSRTTAISRTR